MLHKLERTNISNTYGHMYTLNFVLTVHHVDLAEAKFGAFYKLIFWRIFIFIWQIKFVSFEKKKKHFFFFCICLDTRSEFYGLSSIMQVNAMITLIFTLY